MHKRRLDMILGGNRYGGRSDIEPKAIVGRMHYVNVQNKSCWELTAQLCTRREYKMFRSQRPSSLAMHNNICSEFHERGKNEFVYHYYVNVVIIYRLLSRILYHHGQSLRHRRKFLDLTLASLVSFMKLHLTVQRWL